jgi:hypothetical protein
MSWGRTPVITRESHLGRLRHCTVRGLKGGGRPSMFVAVLFRVSPSMATLNHPTVQGLAVALAIPETARPARTCCCLYRAGLVMYRR